MLHEKKIATNYASALFKNYLVSTEAENALLGLINIWSVILSDNKLYEFFKSPLIPLKRKQQIVKLLASKLKIDSKLEHFFSILIDNSRVEYLPEIIDFFEEMHLEKQGIKTAKVISSKGLNRSQQQAVKRFLEAELGQKVKLDSSQDPNLIGGMVIKYDSILIDCSLKGAIDKIERFAKGADLRDLENN